MFQNIAAKNNQYVEIKQLIIFNINSYDFAVFLTDIIGVLK